MRVQSFEISEFFTISGDTFTNFEKHKNAENIVHPYFLSTFRFVIMCGLISTPSIYLSSKTLGVALIRWQWRKVTFILKQGKLIVPNFKPLPLFLSKEKKA